MRRPPLARANSGLALATAASKSFSVPGLTSIWAISVTIFQASFLGRGLSVTEREKKKRGGRAALHSAEEQNRTDHHHGAADEHDRRPSVLSGVVASAGATLGNQCRLIFVCGREHASEATARGCSGCFERTQNGFRMTAADRLHVRKDTKRMVNSELPSASLFSRQARHSRDRTCGAGALAPPVLQRQRQFFRGLDTVAAAALGLIERGISGGGAHPLIGGRRGTRPPPRQCSRWCRPDLRRKRCRKPRKPHARARPRSRLPRAGMSGGLQILRRRRVPTGR